MVFARWRVDWLELLGDRPRPCLKNGPDLIFIFFYFEKVFSSFFHILDCIKMQSEKYIFENTFWSVLFKSV
jgi:hypothetical protein